MNGLIAPSRRTAISLRPLGAAGVLSAVCALGGLGLGSAAPLAVSADTAPASAIGSANVAWLQVSPAYRTTGLVVAVASDLGCQSNCNHLWVSHNGGAAWAKAAAKDWNGGRPVIGSDATGHDVLFAASTSGLQRSDDGGETWKNAGAGGFMPQVAPTFADDQGVAVAGQHDYVMRKGTSTAVTGSGGAYNDSQFFYAPGAPSGGTPPALLAALGSKNTPVNQQCSADLTCHGSATLANENVAQMASFASLGFSTTYASDHVVFAQANRDVYKSTDAGGSFAPLVILTPDTPTAVVTTPMMALAAGYAENGPVRTLYVAVFEVVPDNKNPHTAGGLFGSDDGGTSWHRMGSPSPLDHGSDAVAVAPDGRIFAGYLSTSGTLASAGLVCSVDGKDWRASCPAVGTAAGGGAAAVQQNGHGVGASSGSSSSGQSGATAAPAGQVAGATSPDAARSGANSPNAASATAVQAKSGGPSSKVLIAGVLGLAVVALGVVRVALRRRARPM